MNTITAKEFQLKHASIIKNVAEGYEYEVTFHRKPIIKLIPIHKKNATISPAGSRDALIKALKFTILAKGRLYEMPYKQLRNYKLKQRYGS